MPDGPRPYPELGEQELRELGPEALLLPTEPYLFDGDDAEELEELFKGVT